MPFKSKAQQGYMFAKHPRLAKEWATKTPNAKELPDKLHPSINPEGRKLKKSASEGHFFRDLPGRDNGMFLEKAADAAVAASSTANAANTQASAAKADQTSKMNIGATGAPVGGSGFRGAGIGGGMYGTGDGECEDEETEEKTAAPSREHRPPSDPSWYVGKNKPSAMQGLQGSIDNLRKEVDRQKAIPARDTRKPIDVAEYDKSPDKLVTSPKDVPLGGGENKPAAKGQKSDIPAQYARNPDTGKLLNRGKKPDPWNTSLAEREKTWAKSRKENPGGTTLSNAIGRGAEFLTGKSTPSVAMSRVGDSKEKQLADLADYRKGAPPSAKPATVKDMAARSGGDIKRRSAQAGFGKNPKPVEGKALGRYRDQSPGMGDDESAGTNLGGAATSPRRTAGLMSGKLTPPDGGSQFAVGRTLPQSDPVPVHVRTGPTQNALPMNFGTGSGKRASVLDLLKTAGASPTDWDADTSLPTGFHRPAREQPEALEDGGERFHSTEQGSVASSRNTLRHGLVEGGSMSMRATASPQIGKHASVSRFMGTSFGIEKGARMEIPEPSYLRESASAATGGSGSWTSQRAGEFGDSLRRAGQSAVGTLDEGAKSIAKSPLAATLTGLLALRFGGKGLVRAGRFGRRLIKGAPPVVKKTGLISGLVDKVRGLASGARNLVEK